jgi:hypothetical protein
MVLSNQKLQIKSQKIQRTKEKNAERQKGNLLLKTEQRETHYKERVNVSKITIILQNETLINHYIIKVLATSNLFCY